MDDVERLHRLFDEVAIRHEVLSGSSACRPAMYEAFVAALTARGQEVAQLRGALAELVACKDAEAALGEEFNRIPFTNNDIAFDRPKTISDDLRQRILAIRPREDQAWKAARAALAALQSGERPEQQTTIEGGSVSTGQANDPQTAERKA